ncbi:flagellar basal body rod protein FlgB [Caldifermentibacillus hisashii]|uniref:flagellar basal body rod protein FlgB n=1 Tax=Caldifermentibacillus hisashii TaxID=996558 RepID=UPI0031B6C170
MKIFSDTIDILNQALDYSTTKQKVISQNIANVDTPNYKAQEVLPFKTILKNELKNTNHLSAQITNNKHIPFSSSENGTITIVKNNTQYNESGNSVDVDQEMTKLAENQIYYNALIDRISGKFQTLQSVIKGGK